MSSASRSCAPAKGGPMTMDQRQSLWLGYLVAGALVQDPERVLLEAKSSAERHIEMGTSGERWLLQWIDLIDKGPDAVLEMLVSRSPRARELRQDSPFAAAVEPRRHVRALDAFRHTHIAKDGQTAW